MSCIPFLLDILAFLHHTKHKTPVRFFHYCQAALILFFTSCSQPPLAFITDPRYLNVSVCSNKSPIHEKNYDAEINGCRSRGRLKKRWGDMILQDMKSLRLRKEHTGDRKKWRGRIRVLSNPLEELIQVGIR